MLLDENGVVSIEKDWLEILFGYKDFPVDQGLYICATPGHKFEGPRGIGLAGIERAGKLSGIGVKLSGYELVLSLLGFSTRRFDERKFVYRPLELYTSGRNFEKSVLLSWKGKADLGTESLEIDSQ
jgi:hypothetical protein